MTGDKSRDTVIVDGNRGIVIVDPNEDTLNEYSKSLQSFTALGERLTGLREKPAVTRANTTRTLKPASAHRCTSVSMRRPRRNRKRFPHQ